MDLKNNVFPLPGMMNARLLIFVKRNEKRDSALELISRGFEFQLLHVLTVWQ